MTAALPDFSKLAMKAGATEDHVGDNLVHVREGSDVAPRNIGAILTMWFECAVLVTVHRVREVRVGVEIE